MKKKYDSRGVSKGMPSGFILSLLVHAAAFSLAGLLVVFTVVQKEEKKFVPPKPVDRPKMKLKKPKVKVKKSAKPKSTQRIVTKVQKASMPDIQLPEMSGVADGLAGDIGGFSLAPDLDEISLMGSGQSIGNDFVGTFYDFKRSRQGKPQIMDLDNYRAAVSRFVRGGWKPSALARYYQSPKKLYATTFMIPQIRSSVAPQAFGEYDTGGWTWLAHYKGQLVYHEDITFRFWGQGDDILIVRVDGEVVLDASWPEREEDDSYVNWQSSSSKHRAYRLGNNFASVGDWVTLKAGEPVDMEVILGELPGGGFNAMLVVEQEGVKYNKNRQSGPILPMFKTSEPSFDLLDNIYEWLVPGEADPVGGPVFRDYVPPERSMTTNIAVTEPEAASPEGESAMRIWTSKSGKTLEAEFISVMGKEAVLKTTKGRQIKMPLSELVDEDLVYIDLVQTPTFKISFSKQSSQKLIATTPHLDETMPRILEYTFGAKVQQTSARSYNQPLQIQFFAVGQQYLDGNKYKLLDRQVSSFIPSQDNGRSHVFTGNQVELTSYDIADQKRGIRYAEYLVVITDSRGEVVQYNSSCNWLYPHLDKLNKIPVGAFLNKRCDRVHPSGPKSNQY